jgi:hypothetical protein
MAMAKDVKRDLGDALPTDERVVLETHPHIWKGVLRFIAVSVIWVVVIAGILVFIALGRPYISDVPYMSDALNAVYDLAFGEEQSAYVALAFYLFMISLPIIRGSVSNNDRVIYFATNRRIIWWSRRIGGIVDSIPLESVKMITAHPSLGRRHRRYGNIYFLTQANKPNKLRYWEMIRDPGTVFRTLQAMTPEPDPVFVRREHIKYFVLLVIIGTMTISLAVYMWTEMVVTAEHAEHTYLKLLCQSMVLAGLLTFCFAIRNLREARKAAASIRKGQYRRK